MFLVKTTPFAFGVTSIVLPIKAIEKGGTGFLATFEYALCQRAGGFTKVAASGGWLDPQSGYIVRDESIRYEVAGLSLDDLNDMLAYILECGEEREVYFVRDGVPQCASRYQPMSWDYPPREQREQPTD